MEPDDDLIAITNYQFPITDDHDYYSKCCTGVCKEARSA